MLCEAKTILLKDGRKALLRSPELSDAAELAAMIRQIAGETDFILRTREESTETPEQEAAFIDSMRQSQTAALLVCQVDGAIAGDCHIQFNRRLKNKHRASLGVGILQKYWNLGIGSAMLRELIRLASERPGVTQLELQYIDGNSRALALYEKMGFRAVCRLPGAIRFPNGELRDEITMIRPIP